MMGGKVKGRIDKSRTQKLIQGICKQKSGREWMPILCSSFPTNMPSISIDNFMSNTLPMIAAGINNKSEVP